MIPSQKRQKLKYSYLKQIKILSSKTESRKVKTGSVWWLVPVGGERI
jgi:hypothetical protein